MHDNFHIICDEDNTRLDVFLSERLSVTRTKVKELIDGGHVRTDGRIPKPSSKVKRSMAIEGEVPEEEPLSLAPEDIPLDILHEDEFFVAINKPAGMVVHPSFGHSSGTLVNATLAYFDQGPGNKEQGSGVSDQEIDDRSAGTTAPLGRPLRWDEETSIAHRPSPIGLHDRNIRPGIVHRLDKGTTGVILIARDSKTQEMLSHLFKERSVRKTYRAVIEGEPKMEQWVVEGNIGRHPIERKKMAVLKTGGRGAETSFKVLKRLAGYSYVEAYPKTGRTHQIRVHLAYAGHPVVGDETYGKRAKALAPRPLLHAFKIEFIHPVMKTMVLIEAPVPADMKEFVREYGFDGL